MRAQILLPVKQPDLQGGRKMSFGYSLLQNKALMEGRALVTALPMQWALLSHGSACGCSTADRQAAGPPMSSKIKLSLQLCSLKSRSSPQWGHSSDVGWHQPRWNTFPSNITQSKCVSRRTCPDTHSCLQHQSHARCWVLPGLLPTKGLWRLCTSSSP